MELENYRYRGARAMVLLHEHHLREFVETWREFNASGKPLPETFDSSYTSNAHLLEHILEAARDYMVWMCSKLGLPDPQIRPTPPPASIEVEADEFLAHLLEKWRTPLVDLPEEVFAAQTYASSWNVHYCIDSMLEHAVMHPIRHTFQLRELLASG